MTGWDDLTAAALLGTTRRSVDVTALPGPLGEAAQRLDVGDPAIAVLDAAALAAPYRRAGAWPAAIPVEPVAPAGPETTSVVGTAAAARLGQLLAVPQTADDKALVLEWLTAASRAQRHAPPETLPALLDASLRDATFAAAAAGVLGARGRWLAQLRPDWQRVAVTHAPSPASLDVTDWELGDTAARRVLFRQLRRSDPAAARELLLVSWPRETGDDRAAFLDALEVGLSGADEALLDAALDDRRKGVRERAAGLLQRLPESAYAARMAERAHETVRVERRGKRLRLVVTPPRRLDEAMVRDGLSPNPPQRGGGQAWWVREIVAATPLPLWPTLTGTTVEQLLALDVDGSWREPLRTGWLVATRRQRDTAWARSLLAAGADPARLPDLVAVLDPAERATVVAGAVDAAEERLQARLTALLELCPAPWPDVLSDAVLGAAAKRAVLPVDHTSWKQLRLAAHRMPPVRAADVTALATQLADGSPWHTVLHTVATTLTFRHDMLEELR